MTHSEMREQKVRLTLELEDAERHLNALRVAAEVLGETLIGLGVALREKPETVYRHGASAHYGQPLETLTVIEDKTVRALEIKKIIEATNEIRKETEMCERSRIVSYGWADQEKEAPCQKKRKSPSLLKILVISNREKAKKTSKKIRDELRARDHKGALQGKK